MSQASHPQSYTAARWEKKGAPLTLAEVPWKDPEEGEVVVKVLACGVCGTDGGLHAGTLLPLTFPAIPGHEVIGDVVAAHPSVKGFQVGDRVGAPWQRGYCGKCANCVAGQLMGCDKAMFYNTGGFADGGLAQYLRVPISGICQVPKDMDPAEVAPLMCAGVTVYVGLRHVKPKPGALVAVQGIGGLGHLAIQYSKAMGFKTVAVSTTGSKKDLALQLGADIFIDESTQDAVEELKKLGGADVVVGTAPSSTATMKMVDALAFQGTLLVLSLPAEPVPFLPKSLVAKRNSITGSFVGTAEDCRETIEFSRKHNIRCIVQKFPLEKAEEAFQHREKARFRAVVVP